MCKRDVPIPLRLQFPSAAPARTLTCAEHAPSPRNAPASRLVGRQKKHAERKESLLSSVAETLGRGYETGTGNGPGRAAMGSEEAERDG